MSSEELVHLRDLLYVLGTALDDVEQDLKGKPPLAEYQRAFRHLHAAASPLRATTLEVRATLDT